MDLHAVHPKRAVGYFQFYLAHIIFPVPEMDDIMISTESNIFVLQENQSPIVLFGEEIYPGQY
jgi:hypothetical protein